MSRILFVTNSLPWPVSDGGSAQRTTLLLEALRSCGEVDILLVHPSFYEDASKLSPEELRTRFGVVGRFAWPEPQARGALAVIGRLPSAPGILARSLAEDRAQYLPDATCSRWVRERDEARSYDIIACRYLRTMAVSGAAQCSRTPVVLDFDDVDWEKLDSRLSATPADHWRKRLLRRVRVAGVRRLALGLVQRCRHVWVTSAEDGQRIRGADFSVLPNIPFAPASNHEIDPCPPQAESRAVLFVGTLSYGPNRFGLERFLGRVWPKVLAAIPDARLRIGGFGLDDDSRRKWQSIPGVEVLGFVTDLRAAYSGCAFTVAPVYWGGGTKIKVLESLAHGRTAVVTPHALAGLDPLRHGEHLWLGADDEGMAAGCIRLLREPAHGEELARRAHSVVREHFSYARFAAVVRSALDRALSTERPVRAALV